MSTDEKPLFNQRTSSKRDSQTSHNSQDQQSNQMIASPQKLDFSEPNKHKQYSQMVQSEQEQNQKQLDLEKQSEVASPNADQNLDQSQKTKSFSMMLKKLKQGMVGSSPVSDSNIHSQDNQSYDMQQFKKEGSVDTPNSQQNNNSNVQLVQPIKRPALNLFSKFKSAYFGNKELTQQGSLTSIDSKKMFSQQFQSASDTPTKVKEKKGALSFLKALALLRSRKVAPVKKMTKEEIRKLFKRSYMTVLAVIRLNKICEDIRNFGTSPNLFDVAIRNRIAVKKVLFPLSFTDANSKKNELNKLQFPLIKPESKLFTIWNPILLSLVFYSATILPYRIAFQDDTSYGWEIFDFIIDGLYWIDLFVNMFSSYYDDDNQLVRKRKTVVMSYLKSWFIIDFLSCIPVDIIAGAIINTNATTTNDTTATGSSSSSSSYSGSQLKLLKLAKIPRLYRLLKITKVIKMAKYFGSESNLLHFIQVNSGILRLTNLLFYVFVAVHFIGCIWFYQAKIFDFSEETWVYRKGLLDADNLTLYLYSIYYVFQTITTVGYGDINAYTNTEIILSLCLMVIGVGFYSSTIGILSSVIQYMDSKQILLQRKIEIMNEYCNEMKIPNNVKKQLKEALQYTLDRNCFIWANQNKIFDQLPMNLKFEICMNIYRGIMKTFSFFNLADDQSFVVRIIPQLRPLKLNAGDIIWNQRDVSDAIYLLSSGRVNYMKQVVEDILTKERKSITFKTMINGSYFGEIDLIMDRKRRYRCQAETNCELYYLTRQEYETIIRKEFPHIHQKLKKIGFDRDKKNEEALKALKKLIRQAKEATADIQVKLHTTNESPLKLPDIKAKTRDSIRQLSYIAENLRSEHEISINRSQERKTTEKEQINRLTAKEKFQRAVKKIVNKTADYQNQRLISDSKVPSLKNVSYDTNIISNNKLSSQNLSQTNYANQDNHLNNKREILSDQNNKSKSSSLSEKRIQQQKVNSDKSSSSNSQSQSQSNSAESSSPQSKSFEDVLAKKEQGSKEEEDEDASNDNDSEQNSESLQSSSENSDDEGSEQTNNASVSNDEDNEDEDDDQSEEEDSEDDDESEDENSDSQLSKQSEEDDYFEGIENEIEEENNKDIQRKHEIQQEEYQQNKKSFVSINDKKIEIQDKQQIGRKENSKSNLNTPQQSLLSIEFKRGGTLKSVEYQSQQSLSQFSYKNNEYENQIPLQKSQKQNLKKDQKQREQKMNLQIITQFDKSKSKKIENDIKKQEQNKESEYIFLKEELRKNNKKMEILEQKLKSLDSVLLDSINLAQSIQKRK